MSMTTEEAHQTRSAVYLLKILLNTMLHLVDLICKDLGLGYQPQTYLVLNLCRFMRRIIKIQGSISEKKQKRTFGSCTRVSADSKTTILRAEISKILVLLTLKPAKILRFFQKQECLSVIQSMRRPTISTTAICNCLTNQQSQ